MRALLHAHASFYLACTLAHAAEPAAAPAQKLYGVVFEILISEKRELVSLRPVRVVDPGADDPQQALDLKIPDTYVAAVRELVITRNHNPRLDKNGKPTAFYTYYFYDPAQPQRADIDPSEQAGPEESGSADAGDGHAYHGEAENFDKTIAPYVARARSEYPEAKARYLAGLPSRHRFYV